MSPAPYDYSAASGYARTRADWADLPATTTAITQTQLDQWDQAIYDKKREIFNVRDFGAKADGVTDDTTAIANALSAASSGGVILLPAGSYKVTSALTVPVLTNASIFIQGVGQGVTKVVYSGSNYCFNFGSGTATPARYQWVRELTIDMSASGTPTGGVNFKGIEFSGIERVEILGPTGGSKILFYFDPGDGTPGNYNNRITHCRFKAQTQASDVGVKLHSTTGNGANSNLVYQTHFNTANHAIEIVAAATNIIEGCEFNGSINTGIYLSGTPTDSKLLFNHFDPPTSGINIASVNAVRTMVIGNSPNDMAYTDAGGTTTRIDVTGVKPASSLVLRRTTPTYGTTVAIDASLGNLYDITATNGTAFTIANPTNALDGMRITITVRNTSGGALGAITWGTLYKLAAWTSPATANSRSIDFKYNGTNWVEAGRTPADVPN